MFATGHGADNKSRAQQLKGTCEVRSDSWDFTLYAEEVAEASEVQKQCLDQKISAGCLMAKSFGHEG